jgi:hypothetical protein
MDLRFFLLLVVAIASINLAWCLTPSNDSPYMPLSAAITVLALCLVPAAWKMNTFALAWLVIINVFVGAVNVYRLWPDAPRPAGLFVAVPFGIAWALWSIRRNALREHRRRET